MKVGQFKLTRITKFKYERISEMNSGLSSKKRHRANGPLIFDCKDKKLSYQFLRNYRYLGLRRLSV